MINRIGENNSKLFMYVKNQCKITNNSREISIFVTIKYEKRWKNSQNTSVR